MLCGICPRKCNTDRTREYGFCGTGVKFKVARSAPHQWEEPCISGTNGSGTVFFSGCSLRCCFCQNYNVSHIALGKEITSAELMRLFDRLIEKGVHNLNFVTPTHYTPMLAEVLREYKPTVPVVWNSSGYESADSLKLLEGLVDIYLPDLKFFDSSVSLKYAGAADYFDYASEAVKEMYRQVGDLACDENGIAKKGVIIRHLVLPGNVSQSFKIFNWVEENIGTGVSVSLLRQYVPYGDAVNMPPLNRKLSAREYSLAKQHILSLGFENCYFQKGTSATEDFIPDFNPENLDL